MKTSRAVPSREAVVVLENGDDLRRSLKDLCLEQGVQALLVRGGGRARSLRLELGGAEERISSPAEVVGLSGSAELRGRQVALDVSAVVSWDGGGGQRVAAGPLAEAVFERALLHVTGLSAPIDPVQVIEPAEASPGAASWQAVAQASAEQVAEPPSAEERPPKPGDFVDHPVFGRCKVVRMDDEHLKVRRESGRTISLGLGRVSLSLTGLMSNGKAVYALEVVKNR